MSTQEQIMEAQKEAMKAGDKERLSILRMTTAALKNAEIDAPGALSEEDQVAVVRKQVKQLQDALGDFEKAGREDLASQTSKEIEILSQFLPAQMSQEDVDAKVAEILSAHEGIQMGQAMGLVMQELKGKADGTVVKEAVARYLNP